MSDIEKARELFRGAGLAFPTIPEKLASQLKERGKWVFSTRALDMSPYNLQHYVHEAQRTHVNDYAVLAHSGYGVNSYAIQYYLVRGTLCMFLHLGWGGVYMDAKAAAAQIRDCFSIADQIVDGAQSVPRFKSGETLTVVGSDFYGSYWLPPGKGHKEKYEGRTTPLAVLSEALKWAQNRQ